MMFLVPTYLGQSRIHGIGVFVATSLARGTRIWEFTAGVDWELTPDELAAFPEPYREKLRSWCYLSEEGLYILCGDNARYMNHSHQPNCDDPEGRFTVTNRDIEPGEELTCDYLTFDMESANRGLDFHATAAG